MYRVLLDTLANGCKRIYIIRKRYSLYFFGGGSEWMFIHRLALSELFLVIDYLRCKSCRSTLPWLHSRRVKARDEDARTVCMKEGWTSGTTSRHTHPSGIENRPG